jgi:hypothetical protein
MHFGATPALRAPQAQGRDAVLAPRTPARPDAAAAYLLGTGSFRLIKAQRE